MLKTAIMTAKKESDVLKAQVVSLTKELDALKKDAAEKPAVK